MMATRSLKPGPAGKRFGPQLRELRRNAGLEQVDLARKLDELGHPIPVTSISRLETGDRRADVSDLIALAVALDVSPIRLLLPADEHAGDVELTENLTVPWDRAWLWATGEMSLNQEPLTGSESELVERVEVAPGLFKARNPAYEKAVAWRDANLPHHPRPTQPDPEQFMAYLDEYHELRQAVAHMERTVPPAWVRNFLATIVQFSAMQEARHKAANDGG